MNATRLLSAQRRLTSSFAPEGEAGGLDRVERGAIGIYGEVTGTRGFEAASVKWATRARPATRERHRAEAKACLFYASI